MLYSSSELETERDLDFDICVVGAGAAGITFVRKFDKLNLKVCMLEAGGLEADDTEDDHPYAGYSIGRPYDMLHTRLRYFGGSTNHWGGWCRPLDPIDFERSPRNSLPGWPIKHDALTPYYDEAASVCQINQKHYKIELANKELLLNDGTLYSLGDEDLTIKNFVFSPPTRFGPVYHDEIRDSKNIHCILDSTVTGVIGQAGKVASVRVKGRSGEFYIRAKQFILCMGGIENARLLLASRSADFSAGNQGDFLGRCFSDHFGMAIGAWLTKLNMPDHIIHVRGERVMPTLSFSDNMLRKHDLPNFGISFRSTYSKAKVSGYWDTDAVKFLNYDDDIGMYHVFLLSESTPNPNSRITLSGDKDAFGIPRVIVDWQLERRDFEGLERIGEILALKVGANNIGRMSSTFNNTPFTRSKSSYVAHHLGTTRMSSDPKFGVVDANCRLFGSDNCYVLGSSVFSTFGFANPTLTIVALALRAARHVKKQIP